MSTRDVPQETEILWLPGLETDRSDLTLRLLVPDILGNTQSLKIDMIVILLHISFDLLGILYKRVLSHIRRLTCLKLRNHLIV